MPFAMANRPPVGISTLKAALVLRGFHCDIHYFNLLLARWIGPDLYQQISDRASHMVFAGEWLFAQELFDRRDIGDQRQSAASKGQRRSARISRTISVRQSR
jgi:hypothetical protein